MDHDKVIASCPVGRSFLREQAAAMVELRPMSLTRLWRDAGSPRGRSPLQKYKGSDEIREEGWGDRRRVLAGYERAYAYAALNLDRTLTLANVFNEVMATIRQAFPVDKIVNGGQYGAYGPVCDAMKHGGLGVDEATRYLLDRVKKEAALHGPYREEDLVCRAQRSLAEVKPMVLRTLHYHPDLLRPDR